MLQPAPCTAARNVLTVFTLLALLLLLPAASAQSAPTASKSAELSASGGFSLGSPDYGNVRDFGGTVGVAFTRYFGWRVAPSFEARGNYYTGTYMDQEALMGGLRLQTDIRRRFHPYANVFYGNMVIKFKFPPSPNYTRDNAGMFGYGGGVDIDVKHSFQARIDFLQETANFGPNGTQPGNADFTLAPRVLTVGVNYRIPLRAHNKQQYLH